MSTARILFVDDEPQVTNALARALRAEPYEIHCRDSAAAGLELLAELDFDIVVSDEQMPGMSGCDFLAEVRRRYPTTIRIILTGQASTEAAIRAINNGGVYRFFTKPCNPDDLKVTLRQAVSQKQLAVQSRRLLHKYRAQTSVLEQLERSSPELLKISRDDCGAILVADDDDDVESVLQEMNELFAQVR